MGTILSLTLVVSLIGCIFSLGKSEKKRERIRLFGAILGGSFFSIPLASSGVTITVTLIPLALFVGIYYVSARKRKKAKEAQENEQKKQNDICLITHTEVLRLLMQHIKTLVTEYGQAIYHDAYGQSHHDAAMQKLLYFVENVVVKNVLETSLPDYISSQEFISYVLSEETSNRIKGDLSDCFIAFFGAADEKSWNEGLKKVAIIHSGVISSAHNANETTLLNYVGKNYKTTIAAAHNMRVTNFRNDVLEHGKEVKLQYSQSVVNLIIDTLISADRLNELKNWFLTRIDRANDLSEIITGEAFEKLCRDRIQALGLSVLTTKATGDFGADLVVEQNGITTIVQCKFYSQPVGVKAVQEAFSAMKFYNAQRAAVVSNQEYTKAARQMAQSNEVMLLHVDDLEMLIA